MDYSLSMDVSWMKFVDRWGGCTTVDEIRWITNSHGWSLLLIIPTMMLDVEPLHTPRMKNRKFAPWMQNWWRNEEDNARRAWRWQRRSLGVARGLVNGDRDHDCKLLLAFVRLFQQEFQKKNMNTNEVLIYSTAMEIASENVCLIF
jgi:hypothetical protein